MLPVQQEGQQAERQPGTIQEAPAWETEDKGQGNRMAPLGIPPEAQELDMKDKTVHRSRFLIKLLYILPLLLQDIGNLFKVLTFYESGFFTPQLAGGFNISQQYNQVTDININFQQSLGYYSE
eukprot:bmy_03737T0